MRFFEIIENEQSQAESQRKAREATATANHKIAHAAQTYQSTVCQAHDKATSAKRKAANASDPPVKPITAVSPLKPLKPLQSL